MVGEVNPPRVHPYNVASQDHAVKLRSAENKKNNNLEKSLTIAAPPGKPRWAAKNKV